MAKVLPLWWFGEGGISFKNLSKIPTDMNDTLATLIRSIPLITRFEENGVIREYPARFHFVEAEVNPAFGPVQEHLALVDESGGDPALLFDASTIKTNGDWFTFEDSLHGTVEFKPA